MANSCNPKRKLDVMVEGTTESRLGNSTTNLFIKRPRTPTDGVLAEPTPGDNLCERCATIDLNSILSSKISTVKGRMIMPLGEVTSDMEHSSCPLCRLFSAVHVPIESKRRFSNRGHQLRAFSLASLAIPSPTRSSHLNNSQVVLGVMPGLSKESYYPDERDECFARGVIAAVAIPEQDVHPMEGLRAHFVRSDEPHYAQMRVWIENCRDHHTRSCQLDDTLSPAALVCIDCYSRALVQVDDGDEYFTLSYVWGHSTCTDGMSRCTFGDQLPSAVPQVIEDAIAVVQNLGGRYLWVDKYCIDQQDVQKRHVQIQNMGNIYERACATIIAVDGSNAEAGLPGVGCAARKAQPSAKFGGVRLVSTLPHISLPLEKSVWVTRGWTYQEAVLSRRCLFFTKHQVYFACRAMNCCEALDWSRMATMTPGDRDSLVSTQIFDRTEIWRQRYKRKAVRRAGLWSYFDHLSKYTDRRLTFEQDAVNAFQGLLTKLSYRHIWGIPIACHLTADRLRPLDYDIGFARGLWWDSRQRWKERTNWLRRSPHFPSWSWAGWIGAASSAYAVVNSEYQHDSKCNEVSRNDFNTHFLIELGDKRQISLEAYCESFADTALARTLSHSLTCEGTVLKVKIQPPSAAVRIIGDGNDTGYVCDCHPSKVHEGNRFEDYKAATLHLLQDPATRKGFKEQLFDQLWDCMVLFVNEKDAKLIVVEWCGDIAYRIGSLRMKREVYDILPATRRVLHME